MRLMSAQAQGLTPAETQQTNAVSSFSEVLKQSVNAVNEVQQNAAEMKTLPVGLAAFLGVYATDWPLLMAGAMLMILPMIVVFVVCQRFFVEGIRLGAVKG